MRPRSPRDTDEFFRSRVRRAVGRPPAHARREGRPSWASQTADLADLADGAGRARARPHPGAARPRPARSTRPVRPYDTERGRRRATRELASAISELQAGQGRVGDRPAAGRDRRDRARLRGRRPGPAGRPARSPSGCIEGVFGLRARARRQRRRLQLDRRRRRPRARSCTGSATTAPPRPGELLLMDMGVENRNLYTADVTRTVPVSGRSPPLQRAGLRHRVRVAAGRHRRRSGPA